MSIFNSLMNDMERDPIFGAHHREMNRMMSGFFNSDPGSMFNTGFHNSLMGPPQPPSRYSSNQSLMSFTQPFGFNSMFGGGFHMPNMLSTNMQQPLSYCSATSVTSISSGPDGRPHVYQASSSTRQEPNGIKETRKIYKDSQNGIKKISHGRHIGNKVIVKEREDNLRTGQREENHEFINLDEDEADQFEDQWGQLHRRNPLHSNLAIGYNNIGSTSNRRGIAPSSSNVTIEELPPSDEEEEEEKKIKSQQRKISSQKRSKRVKKY